MKAFLIDPHTRMITEVDQNGQNDLCYLIDCHELMAVPLPACDVIYADDSKDCTALFRYRGNSTPINGIGVVVGSDDEGDDDIPAHSLTSLTNRIEWLAVSI